MDDEQWVMYHSISCVCPECLQLDSCFFSGAMHFGKITKARVYGGEGEGMITMYPRGGKWVTRRDRKKI